MLNRVVSVHGLYGHRIGTWTTDAIGEEPGTSWMKEQIYREQPDSQVWTYGYDASINKSGIATRMAIQEKAYDLLDKLLEMRKKWKSVRADCVKSSISSIKEKQADKRATTRNQFH